MNLRRPSRLQSAANANQGPLGSANFGKAMWWNIDHDRHVLTATLVHKRLRYFCVQCFDRQLSFAMSLNSNSPTAPPPAPPQPANAPNCNLVHLNPLPPSVFTLPQTAQLEALYTIIRDKETSRGDFLFYSDRVIRLLVEEGLNHLPVVARTVETPTVSF